MRWAVVSFLVVSACHESTCPEGASCLSESELYDDFDSRAFAVDTMAFEPVHVLWSDGATKRRFLQLPAGTTIDTTDMDRWVFPIGTRVFKEFSRDGVLVETRRIARVGTGPFDYEMSSFVWLPDGSDAVETLDGAQRAGERPGERRRPDLSADARRHARLRRHDRHGSGGHRGVHHLSPADRQHDRRVHPRTAVITPAASPTGASSPPSPS